MKAVEDLKVKIFADGADMASMIHLYHQPHIKGLTTNPTLMRKAGITDYRMFCREVLQIVKDKPISFEVFSDDPESMEVQALEISSWGSNVFVKIPVSNSKGIPCYDLIQKLTKQSVKVNVTAIMDPEQIRHVAMSLTPGCESFVSVFAGRIADTGRDPLPILLDALKFLDHLPECQLIWASPRELLNIFQADQIGVHVITVTNDILNKLSLVGKNLMEYSLETVAMFYNDAQKAGFRL